MKFFTLFTTTHITAGIPLLYKAKTRTSVVVTNNKNLSSKAVSNSHTLSTYPQNNGGIKSFDTAFVAYQMMGLG